MTKKELSEGWKFWPIFSLGIYQLEEEEKLKFCQNTLGNIKTHQQKTGCIHILQVFLLFHQNIQIGDSADMICGRLALTKYLRRYMLHIILIVHQWPFRVHPTIRISINWSPWILMFDPWSWSWSFSVHQAIGGDGSLSNLLFHCSSLCYLLHDPGHHCSWAFSGCFTSRQNLNI